MATKHKHEDTDASGNKRTKLTASSEVKEEIAASSSSSASSAFQKLLQSKVVTALVDSSKPVLVVNSDTDLVQAFQAIFAAGVQSAPVWDEKQGKFLAFLDVHDLAKIVVDMLEDERQGNNPVSALPKRRSSALLKDMFNAVAKSLNKESYEAVPLSFILGDDYNKFVSVTPDANCLEVAQLLCKPSVYRVAIVAKGSNSILGVVSHTSFIQYISSHMQEPSIAPLVQRTVQETGLHKSTVHQVRKRTTAFDTFKQLASHHHTGFAVVDHLGKLVGNTSASDIRLLLQEPSKSLPLLDMPVLDFVSKLRQSSVQELREFPSISVKPSSTIAHTVALMAATKIHHVFVTEDQKPVGSISVKDLLATLLR